MSWKPVTRLHKQARVITDEPPRNDRSGQLIGLGKAMWHKNPHMDLAQTKKHRQMLHRRLTITAYTVSLTE